MSVHLVPSPSKLQWTDYYYVWHYGCRCQVINCAKCDAGIFKRLWFTGGGQFLLFQRRKHIDSACFTGCLVVTMLNMQFGTDQVWSDRVKSRLKLLTNSSILDKSNWSESNRMCTVWSPVVLSLARFNAKFNVKLKGFYGYARRNYASAQKEIYNKFMHGRVEFKLWQALINTEFL